MRLFAIADPHLSKLQPKPMDIFGGNWQGHPGLFFERWREVVAPEDIVIVAGDISWALRLPEAMADLEDIAALPGQKILLRGNHDYWWPSISKLRAALPAGMLALQNDSVILDFGAEKLAIAGTRGWTCPGQAYPGDTWNLEDEKIYKRELERLALATKSLVGQHYDRLVIALHYPPTNVRFEPSGFTALIEAARPDALVYGHLHGVNPQRVLRHWNGIPTKLVAADAVEFRPQLILTEGPRRPVFSNMG
jgi:uncharacterized protein